MATQIAFTANPLREGISTKHRNRARWLSSARTGDLTHRKLVPALYNLAHEGQLPQSFAIVGFARRPKTHDQFRAELRDAVQRSSRASSPINPAVWEALAQAIFYHQSEFADAKGYRLVGQVPGEDRSRTRHRRQSSVLSCHRADGVHRHHPATRGERTGSSEHTIITRRSGSLSRNHSVAASPQRRN